MVERMSEQRKSEHNFVVVASRLPVDRAESQSSQRGGEQEWRTSPGGLVTADASADKNGIRIQAIPCQVPLLVSKCLVRGEDCGCHDSSRMPVLAFQ